jgi:peptide deformylase
MQPPLLKYPDPRIRLISGNVRFFNETLHDMIEDMTDTMKAEGLDALTAIQIGVQYNVIVLKEGDEYVPYINARIVRHSGQATETERTPYYENMSVDVPRYTEISVVYEDPTGQMQTRTFEGEGARVFQHQLDYAFGSTFVDRVSKEVKKQIHDHLEFGLVKDSRDPNATSETCPSVFYRDYFRRAYKYMMLAIALSFLTPFFVSETTQRTIYTIDKWGLLLTLALIAGYFFYAEYETKKYKQCTSCQTGNIIGTMALALAQLLVVTACVFLWMG